jgi:uncharacterized protein (TIGR02118 family)
MKMIKQIFLVKKKPGMSFDEYKKYYLEHHAPLVKKTIPDIRKYVLNFALQRGKETPFDSIGELYWDDYESIVKFFKSDAYKNIIAPDEAKFIDRDGSQVILTEENIQK